MRGRPLGDGLRGQFLFPVAQCFQLFDELMIALRADIRQTIHQVGGTVRQIVEIIGKIIIVFGLHGSDGQ